MKKIILILLFIGSNFSYSQTIKLDTLIGKNGILKRFSPKEISYGQKLSFNLRLIYTLKDKSGKEQKVCAYMNTKYGYIGILPSKNDDYTFNSDAKDFKLMVYSNSMQNFMFSTSKKGKKTVMSMPIAPKTEIKMDDVTVKQENSIAKKSTNLNIDSFGYNNSKTASNEKIVMYLSDSNITGTFNSKSKLCHAGLGFYEINGKTVLNMSIEKNGMKITIDKIESVNVSLNSGEFKKEESGVSKETIEAMMEKLKKK
ncbi:hypothetical protein OX283_013860 [Flavobacterium sp. SUN052]|uniref:hypothetical protein n=1 Tax=Flavobacterium sp. SUN052 TaxID=3002441 RepID=UPI00237E0161|nr:hypothetical protein [Flavobacterium sp. SUN052]MEC4005752.1 hypothetical protein [Flavobacterium sp. SUN052]